MNSGIVNDARIMDQHRESLLRMNNGNSDSFVLANDRLENNELAVRLVSNEIQHNPNS
jgi:hypothetical protein